MFLFISFITLLTMFVLIVAFLNYSSAIYCESQKRLQGKTVIVTGGTSGIGLEVAKDLAHRGARVIIACPFEDEGEYARELITSETGNKNVVFKHLDQGSLKSVRAFAADIINSEDRLDILINNAGVGGPDEFITSDGLHFVMHVNYYGVFLLTLLLLPLLKKTGRLGEPSRIITTSSTLHYIGFVEINKMNQLKLCSIKDWCKMRVYGNSKICLIYFVNELRNRLEGSRVTVNTVDPGLARTKILNSACVAMGVILTLSALISGKTPKIGAQTTLYAALEEKFSVISGAYIKDCKIRKAASRAYNDTIGKLLWDESVKLVKLTDKEQRCCC